MFSISPARRWAGLAAAFVLAAALALLAYGAAPAHAATATAASTSTSAHAAKAVSAAAATAEPCDIYASGGTPCEAAYSTTRALVEA